DVIKNKLRIALSEGEQVFTGAHIVYSPPGISKIEAIVDTCTALYFIRHEVEEIAQKTQKLQRVFDKLTEVHCVGGFMAYEMVTDIRHNRVLFMCNSILFCGTS